jgi:hypothetical protein
MDIAEVDPHQFAPSVGILGVGVMESTIFSASPSNNSIIVGGQIRFGSIDFLPHPPTLLPVFDNLYQGMDPMVRS